MPPTQQTECQTQRDELGLSAALQGVIPLLRVLTLAPGHTVHHPLVVHVAEAGARDAGLLEVIVLVNVEVKHGVQVHKLLVTGVGERRIYLGLRQPLPQATRPHRVEDDALWGRGGW